MAVIEGVVVWKNEVYDMSSLTFVDDMACIQRSVAQCHDQVVRRGLVLDVMQLHSGEQVLEVGCGGGFYAYEVAKCVYEVTSEEADAWFKEFELLEQQHAYFFCLTSVLTEAMKIVR